MDVDKEHNGDLKKLIYVLANAFLFAGKSPSWTRDIKRRLKAGRYYLKTDFKVHVSTESLCADHCRVFALSDTDCDLKGTCLHEHTLSCASCDDLRNVLAEIEMALSCADATFR